MVAIQSGAGNKSKKSWRLVRKPKKCRAVRRNIEIVRPMKDGVIADFVITERMLGMLIKKSHRRTVFGSARVVICVPGGSTSGT